MEGDWFNSVEKILALDHNEWVSRKKRGRRWVEDEHSLEKLTRKLLNILKT